MTSADAAETEGDHEPLGNYELLYQRVVETSGYSVTSFNPDEDPQFSVELNGWVYYGDTFSEAVQHAINDDVPPITEEEPE